MPTDHPDSVSELSPAEVCDYMRQHGLVIATAESCTAGLISATLADVEGAGELLECGFVTYTPAAKTRCLSVRPATIEQFGLTSEAVVKEMAVGALRCSTASLAIANVGVVDDIDPQISVGTQCFAWAFTEKERDPIVFVETHRFSGDRRQIRESAARYAISAIVRLHEKVTASDRE
jgi:nicotinamide-nucleotide amidase